ncbi:MAG: tetratricopeptide repeat protein [Candidatus Eisenbacteria bacterium]|nr:tetratricopeptide repeat protein [Candidatus Eisenbacteria bacterium]
MDGFSWNEGAWPYLLGAAALVVIALVVWLARRVRRARPPRSRYLEALNALLEGDEETALRELRETVLAERTNFDAYLRLGNLLRKKGAVDRALRIHRDLDVGTFFRRKLSRTEKLRVREAIADDYMAARRARDALRVLGDLLRQNKANPRIRSKMVSIHERLQEWDRAFDLYREGFRIRNEAASAPIARYRAFCGSSFEKAGEKERAVEAYQDALKIDPKCPEALYRLGAFYHERKDLENAILYWSRFHMAAPDQAHLTFVRFENALFETGDLNRMEDVYRMILEEAPTEEHTLLNLSLFYARRGEADSALETAREAVERNPASAAARDRLVQLSIESRASDGALADLIAFLKNHPPPDRSLYCSQCGYRAEEPFWRCPQCLLWNTIFTGPARTSSASS